MKITLSQAAALAGVSKTAIRKAMKAGRLTGERDEGDLWRVDVADVQRLWPKRPDSEPVPGNGFPPVSDGYHPGFQQVVEELRARIVDKDSVIDDLRGRLDAAEDERTRLLGVIDKQTDQVKLLTDQRERAAPARRSLWRFWR